MLVNLLSNVSFYLPEIIVIVTMCVLLCFECFYSDDERGRSLSYIIGLIGIFTAFMAVVMNLGTEAKNLFAGAVVIDQFTNIMKMMMLLGTAGCFYLSAQSKEIHERLKAEFLIMSLGVLVGGMLLVSANNLLTVYLGVETLSILSYVMTTMKKDDAHSSEAGIKYALYGGVTAGVMLFGMSHLYGILGSIHFLPMVEAMSDLSATSTVATGISFLLFFVGVGYKIACFPFHMWSPDVYEGSAVPVTAFFSIIPKLAGIAIVTRITMIFFNSGTSLAQAWLALIQIVAALTMFVGNLSALNQESVKRMLAFSSIGHVGMILMGVLVLSNEGQTAILYYSLIYMLMTLSAFYITGVVVNKYGSDERIFFRGLMKNNPILGGCFVIVLFSLAGLPPFGGFIAKYNMISVAVGKGLITLSIIAAINSVISLYYYMKLVRIITLEDSDGKVVFESFNLSGAVYVLAVTAPLILLGIFWNGIYSAYSI